MFENRRTEFQLNLITLDSEHLGIPETQYSSEVTMNAQDFQKLCKELSETAIKFNVEGDESEEGGWRYLNMFNKASTLCNNVKLMLASSLNTKSKTSAVSSTTSRPKPQNPKTPEM